MWVHSPPGFRSQNPAANTPSQPSGGKYDGKGLLKFGMLMPCASCTVTFTSAGGFDYVCILHRMMKGQVVGLPADGTELVNAGVMPGQTATLNFPNAGSYN